MRTWHRALLTTPTATDDFQGYVKDLIAEENKLTKANTLEQLWRQRGKVEAYEQLLYSINQAKEKK